MAMRLQEVHPSIVHFPIALLPVALGADALGVALRRRSLLEAGRLAIALTAGSAALAGLTGLVAQEEVRADGDAHSLLVTHRSVNLVVLGITAGMALKRRRSAPTRSYFAAGVAALAGVIYSAYLGGKMVYEHGVGVRAAGGIRAGHGPELTLGHAGSVARHALGDAAAGVRTAAGEISRGEVAPALSALVARSDGLRET